MRSTRLYPGAAGEERTCAARAASSDLKASAAAARCAPRECELAAINCDVCGRRVRRFVIPRALMNAFCHRLAGACMQPAAVGRTHPLWGRQLCDTPALISSNELEA